MDLHRNIVQGLHKEAERLAFAFYLRKGRVPARRGNFACDSIGGCVR